MKTQNKYRMYLGRNRKQGAKVSVSSFDLFANDHIIPALDCYTIIPAYGVWNGSAEQVFIVEVISDAPTMFILMEKIAKAYKCRFSQECVLITREAVGVELI